MDTWPSSLWKTGVTELQPRICYLVQRDRRKCSFPKVFLISLDTSNLLQCFICFAFPHFWNQMHRAFLPPNSKWMQLFQSYFPKTPTPAGSPTFFFNVVLETISLEFFLSNYCLVFFSTHECYSLTNNTLNYAGISVNDVPILSHRVPTHEKVFQNFGIFKTTTFLFRKTMILLSQRTKTRTGVKIKTYNERKLRSVRTGSDPKNWGLKQKYSHKWIREATTAKRKSAKNS